MRGASFSVRERARVAPYQLRTAVYSGVPRGVYTGVCIRVYAGAAQRVGSEPCKSVKAAKAVSRRCHCALSVITACFIIYFLGPGNTGANELVAVKTRKTVTCGNMLKHGNLRKTVTCGNMR